MFDLSLQEWVTVGGLAIAGLIGLLVLGVVAVGLFQARSLIRRELAAYFLSPIAYVIFVVFLALTGYLFNQAVDKLAGTRAVGVEYPLRLMYGDAEFFWLVFLFIPPVLTMRSFAEERASGTLEVLLTAPVRDWQVVLSKYVACLIFYVLLWLPTLVYLPLLLGLQATAVPIHMTLHSWGWLGGLGLTLVGLVLLIMTQPQGAARTVFLVVTVVGAAAAGAFAGIQGKTLEDAQSAAGDAFALTPSVMLALSGVAVAVIGFLLLLPRLSSGGRLASLLLIVFGAAAATTGGCLHYQHDERVVLAVTSGLDPASALTLYLGVFLAGAMFLALGLFVSSLVRDQLVAALAAMAVGLPFIAAAFFKPDLDSGGFLDQLIYFFSVPLHFSKTFTRGLLDTRPLVLYVSLTAFFLFLTVRSLESRRWR